MINDILIGKSKKRAKFKVYNTLNLSSLFLFVIRGDLKMYDIIIIGAGITGCAAARELSKYKLNIAVLEKHEDAACGTTKANSAIVHAGFDAEEGSLKAKLNVRGNAMFEKLSKELDFPFKRIGSLVLCFDEKDIDKLYKLKKQGEINGVTGLEIIDGEKAGKMEPALGENVAAALYAPTGGITCPYEMTIAYAENAYANGTEFKFNTEVKKVKKQGNIFLINTSNGDYEANIVINAAGVYSDNINNMVSSNKIHITPRKGEYCLFDKAAGNTVSRTIFQLPTPMGKGVLVTPTVDGNLLIGPNAVDIDDKDDVNTTEDGLNDIIRRAKKSIKNIPMNAVITSFSGLRAHSIGDDFIIGEAKDTENFINAAGIESPGLSAAPAIAHMIEEIVVKKLNPVKDDSFNPVRKGIPKFREMTNEERKEIIKKYPEYGRVICRCETVTEGEIINSIRRPLGARTLDGVKRRTRAGMGRCQSGFCSTRIVDILARELGISPLSITKSGGKSVILTGRNKENL